jgi:acyl-CoA synthetase (AMP-forming)/AMP-acid ligase II
MDLTVLARERGEKPAYVHALTGESISFRELELRSNRIAHLLRNLGLDVGDHIAVLAENTLAWFPVVWAAQRIGVYYTPINWHLTPSEAAYVLDNCDAQVLFSSASLESTAVAALAGAPRVRHRFTLDGSVAGVEDVESAAGGLPTTPVEGQVEGSYMYYSSGTTGRPKGVLPQLSGSRFGAGLPLDNAQRMAYGFDDRTTFLSPGPLYHAAPLGWSMSVARFGGTTIVMPAFDAALLLGAIETHRATHVQLVPTMFVRMLKLPSNIRAEADLSSLRVVVHAAAPCPPEVKRKMIDWLGPIIVEYYAGSESNGLFAVTSEEWLEHPGTVGRAIVGTPHVVGADGEEAPPGTVGEIWVSDGPDFEYYKDPEKTAAAHNAKGWTTIGDLGHLDADGYLYLSVRRVDLIISGGVNIYPREIEDALALHPAVEDLAVIGLPDDEWGQRVHAVVVPTDLPRADDALAADLRAFLDGRVARYKIPRTFEFVSDLPRLPNGKLLKRQLLDERT